MKGRPSLFEVMNKAPETSGNVAPRTSGRWWHRDSGGAAEGPVQIVAEALTEEQAAEELAAQAAVFEEAEREKSSRDAERQARREAKRAERAAMRAAAVDFVRTRLALGDAAPIVERSGDRLVVSVNLTGGLIAAALLCVVFVGVYLAGQRAGAKPGGGKLVEAAALTNRSEDSQTNDSATRPIRVATRNVRRNRPPDLSGLTTGRVESSSPASTVRANQPASVLNRLPEDEPGAERLNYLAIQWFDFSGRKRDEVIDDVRTVQQFLADRGVETVARKVSGGVHLYSRKGYLMADEHRSERQTFQRQVAEHGKTYRRQGGQGMYEWTDCYFVSYGHATKGEPI